MENQNNILIDLRPKTPEDLLYPASDRGLRTLIANPPQTLLLTGQYGGGKTTIATVLAHTHSLPENMHVYGLKNGRGIEDAREILSRYDLPPLARDPSKKFQAVLVLDEVHLFTKDAQGTLLQFVEEPPKWLMVICCTTDPGKLLPTLRSRMIPHEVKPMDPSNIAVLVSRALGWLHQRGYKIAGTPEQYTQAVIAKSITSSRMVISSVYSMVTGSDIEAPEEKGDLFPLVQQAARGDIQGALTALKEFGREGVVNFKYVLLTYCTSILYTKRDAVAYHVCNELTAPISSFSDVEHAASIVAALRRVEANIQKR